MKLNPKCSLCQRDCKQDFEAVVVKCPLFEAKLQAKDKTEVTQ